MRRRVIRLTVMLAAGFAVLLVQLTNLGFVSADALRRHQLNNRDAAAAVGTARGAILSADGEVLAEPIGRDDAGPQLLRAYPHGPLYAHVAGYLGAVAGAGGVERSYNGELSGTATGIAVRELTDLFDDSGRVGDVELTLSHAVQLTARAALGDRDGAVVAIEPTTGAVIAMWSRPSFDPEALVSLTPGADPSGAHPPAARAYQRHYALRSDESISEVSAELLELARRATGSTGIDLPAEPSGANPIGAGNGATNAPQVHVTPLQLAVATASIANDGIRMRPHVVRRVHSRLPESESAAPDASVETAPREAGRFFEPVDAAALLARMAAETQQSPIRLAPANGRDMIAALAAGRLADRAGSGMRTGSWAALLAPADAPTVAVAVLIEPDAALDISNDQGGGTLAATIAAATAEAALALRPAPQPNPDRP